MGKEPRIDKTVFAKTRHQACEKVAMDFIRRNAVSIAKHILQLGVGKSVQYEYLCGYSDGFSMAIELILSGSLNLQEINKDNPGPGKKE